MIKQNKISKMEEKFSKWGKENMVTFLVEIYSKM